MTVSSLLFIMTGCEKEIAVQTQPWEPTSVQTLKAEEIAQRYAIDELGISETQLSRMKTEMTSWKKDGTSLIYMQFFDPIHFPNWENIAGVRGGFPAYFTISIDVESGCVIDHYASPQ